MHVRTFFIVVLVTACSGVAAPTTAPPTTAAPTTTTTTSPPPATTTTVAVTPPTMPSVDLPAGWELVSADGFVVGLPATWRELDLAAGDLESMAEALGENSAVAEVLRSQSSLLQTAELFAYDTSDVTFATNLNVLPIPGGGLTAEALEAAVPAQLEAFGATVTDVSLVTGEGWEAVRVAYELAAATLGTPADIVGAAYYVVADRRAWAVTYSTDDPARIAAEFDAIMETFTAP